MIIIQFSTLKRNALKRIKKMQKKFVDNISNNTKLGYVVNVRSDAFSLGNLVKEESEMLEQKGDLTSLDQTLK